ncbi:hypothetical protein WJX77_008343 [Trebouxia sp. C0004]
MPGRPNFNAIVKQTSQKALEANPREVEAFTKLNLCNRGLVIIPRLEANLVEIDLSGNGLVRTTGLANLHHLQKLVLTSNHITELQDLTGLPALQHLLLQGNFLCTLQDVGLHMLAQLPQLQSLYLQNSDTSQPNPVCSRPEYKSVVLTTLTHLRNLDGERRPSCRDELASKADDSLPNITKLSSDEADITKFLPSEWDAWLAEDADVGTQHAHSDLHQAGAATAKALDECNVLSGSLKDELAKVDRLLKQ